MMLGEKIAKKYASKSLAKLLKIAQEKVNAYVRKRDAINAEGEFICISCNTRKVANQVNAGHYFSKGNFPSVRFDLDNIHSQCIKCNFRLSGNLILYRKNLIEKIGEDRFKELEALAYLNSYKHDRNLIINIIERFKKL